MKKKSKRYKSLLQSKTKDQKLSTKDILELLKKNSNTKFDESTFLRVSYNDVKNLKSVKPTIHKYLSGYVRSRFRRIDADEFVIATLLPVQRFKKATASAVWSDSRRML